MSISTLAELKTALDGWTKRADLSSYWDNIILTGEKWIFRHARAREMESALSVTISGGVAAIPADFVSLKHARISGYRPLSIRPPEWIYSQYPVSTTGELPSYIGVDGSNFVFGPSPGGNTLIGTYYARQTSIISGVSTFFTNNPDLYLFAALAETVLFLKDDKRVDIWTAKRNQICEDVNGEAVQSRYGGPMEVRTS